MVIEPPDPPEPSAYVVSVPPSAVIDDTEDEDIVIEPPLPAPNGL